MVLMGRQQVCPKSCWGLRFPSTPYSSFCIPGFFMGHGQDLSSPLGLPSGTTQWERSQLITLCGQHPSEKPYGVPGREGAGEGMVTASSNSKPVRQASTPRKSLEGPGGQMVVTNCSSASPWTMPRMAVGHEKHLNCNHSHTQGSLSVVTSSSSSSTWELTVHVQHANSQAPPIPQTCESATWWLSPTIHKPSR